MDKLNLPSYNFSLKSIENKTYIFDKIRKKYVVLTPEEWVRQNFVMYLIHEKNYPESLFIIEIEVTGSLKNRTDINFYNNKGKLSLIIECKAPKVKISQDTFDQISRYTMNNKPEYLIVTNGMQHYCCKFNYETNKYLFINEIPDFETIKLDTKN